MSSILMVPVHLDALVLKNDQAVVEAAAEFSRLFPYLAFQRKKQELSMIKNFRKGGK